MSDNLTERYFRIVNYYDHPQNPSYMVFHFLKKEQSDTFRESLIAENIPFESETDTEKNTVYLYAVKKNYSKRAIRLNFLAIGQHREKFIGDPVLRWALLGFFLIAVALALAGLFLNKN
jgi:hypothetical protein